MCMQCIVARLKFCYTVFKDVTPCCPIEIYCLILAAKLHALMFEPEVGDTVCHQSIGTLLHITHCIPKPQVKNGRLITGAWLCLL